MKFLVGLLLAVGVAVYFWQHRGQQSKALDSILNPVYAETRVQWNIPGRSTEGVMLAKTTDQADCQQYARRLETLLQQNAASICPSCKVQPSVCSTELSSRYTQLFDNKPLSVTYLTMDRGDASERETRLIYWGVSVAESDRLCGVVNEFQKGRKGKVNCVRAARE